MRIRMMTSFFVSCWLAKGYGKRKGIASLTPPITERMGHIYEWSSNGFDGMEWKHEGMRGK